MYMYLVFGINFVPTCIYSTGHVHVTTLKSVCMCILMADTYKIFTISFIKFDIRVVY